MDIFLEKERTYRNILNKEVCRLYQIDLDTHEKDMYTHDYFNQVLHPVDIVLNSITPIAYAGYALTYVYTRTSEETQKKIIAFLNRCQNGKIERYYINDIVHFEKNAVYHSPYSHTQYYWGSIEGTVLLDEFIKDFHELIDEIVKEIY